METALNPGVAGTPHTNGKPEFRQPLISFIVPIYKISQITLKRCLASLTDQDYPNTEIICVLDGDDPALAKVATEFTKSVIVIYHAGAPAARNAGFNASKGEIVSFFNSDYMAKPGMARRWVDALLSHPDCGFAYGGYAYTSATAMLYPSKPFNPFLLQVANYIDCGFPLWRKNFVPWDVDCKSLQDWDFWIRVVNIHQVKGFYLGAEASFMAEPSGKPGGLSEDSARNWIDRVHYIKAKNKIPEPPIVVTSLGAANHGIAIAKLLKADFRDDTIFKPNKYAAVYMIGFYNRGQDMKAHAEIIAHFKRQKDAKVILHFVGADIYWLRHRTFTELKYLSGALRLQCDYILSENQQAQKELAEMGIPSLIVPIPPSNEYQVQPLPAEFRMAVFVTNRSDFDKYCLEETLSICRAMPDVQFSAYGDAADASIQYPNLKCVGNLSKEEWKQFVYDHSCILRLVRHDTLPLAPMEFMLAGRDAITNVPMKFAQVIDTAGKIELNQWDVFGEGLNTMNWPATKAAIVKRIRAVRRMQQEGASSNVRHDAAYYYRSLLSKTQYIDRIRELAGIPKETR